MGGKLRYRSAFAVAAVALMLIPGILTAWYIARRKSPLTFAVENLVQLPLVLPPVVTGLLLLSFLGPNGAGGRILDKFLGLDLAFTAWGAALAAGIMAFPLLVQTFRVAIEQIDPEWEEAVSVYGGGRWAAFSMGYNALGCERSDCRYRAWFCPGCW